jgi:hypothetical protein
VLFLVFHFQIRIEAAPTAKTVVHSLAHEQHGHQQFVARLEIVQRRTTPTETTDDNAMQLADDGAVKQLVHTVAMKTN